MSAAPWIEEPDNLISERMNVEGCLREHIQIPGNNSHRSELVWRIIVVSEWVQWQSRLFGHLLQRLRLSLLPIINSLVNRCARDILMSNDVSDVTEEMLMTLLWDWRTNHYSRWTISFWTCAYDKERSLIKIDWLVCSCRPANIQAP